MFPAVTNPHASTTPDSNQLLQIIKIQSEIMKIGIDLGGIMQFVVEQVLDLIRTDGAAIELAEDGDMVYRAASGIAKNQLGLRLNIKGSLSGLCVTTGETLLCNDSEIDPRVNREACQKIGLRSMLIIPLKHNETTVGVLKAMGKLPNAFSEIDISLLSLISESIADSMFFSTKYDSNALFIKATHDSMTGLANRALFMDRFYSSLARTNRDKLPFSLLMIDVDGLKQINDNHGHRVGDAYIVEVANRLKKATRTTETVARLGGDEFGVLLSPVYDVSVSKKTAERINSEISTPFHYENVSCMLKVSIGSAVIPEDGVEPNALLEIADQRMYASKRLKKLLDS